jgi:hypothetical protein
MSWDAILCADWSKAAAHREVYVADVGDRTIRRLDSPRWDLSTLLGAAESCIDRGGVLVGIDVPLGIPRSLADPSRQTSAVSDKTFATWLRQAGDENPGLFITCDHPDAWSPRRPFFAVAAGQGERNRWFRALRSQAVEPFRVIDKLTGAKSLFIVSGMPGTVGSGAREVWRELLPLLINRRRLFKIWPFDGDLDRLAGSGVVLGEIYPRAAYGLALHSDPPAGRRRLAIAKTQVASRQAAIEALLQQTWVQRFGVDVRDLEAARQSEDAFDALMSAAGLLRCICEGTVVAAEADRFEGGILGAASLNLSLSEVVFAASGTTPPPRRRAPEPGAGAWQPSEARPDARLFPCPIPECSTVFRGSRGGWDAHVASLARHPRWHPDQRDPLQRKELFRQHFPGFFH